MSPETYGESRKGEGASYETDFNKMYPFLKDEQYENFFDEESSLSMKINRYIYNRDLFAPTDKKLFMEEYSEYKEESEEPAQLNQDRKDLVHIIQILRGPNKKKEIKVEEVFEIANKEKRMKKTRVDQKKLKKDDNPKEIKPSSLSGISTLKLSKKTRAKSPVTSKSHPNSQIYREKRNIRIKNDGSHHKESENVYNSQTEADVVPSLNNKKLRKSSEKIRPYMLDAKSRREIKDFDQYLNRKNSSLNSHSCVCNSKVPTKVNKAPFEIKYVSSGFVRTSDLSLPETSHESSDTLKSSVVMEKYQTEPRVKNTSFFRDNYDGRSSKNYTSERIESMAERERELYEFFEEYPKLIPSNKKTSKSYSIFDKLKGDERDLPGIYSRFVRRSKGVSNNLSEEAPQNFLSSNKINDPDNSTVSDDEELEDHIEGELIKEKPTNEKLLELINKNPFKFDKKSRENFKNKKAPTKKSGAPDVSIPAQEKKPENITVKKKKAASTTNTKSPERKKSKDLQITQNNKKITNRKHSKKNLKGSQVVVDITDHTVDEGHKQMNSPAILSNDPIKENLNMSPTTAITMMVLAADKVLAGKTEFFGKTNRRLRSNSEICAEN